MNNQIALRMDDVGASSKQFEVYSKRWKGAGNFLFLKYLPWFKAWGKYPELNPSQWEAIFEVLKKYEVKMTIGVTASWVDKNSHLRFFGEMFPRQLEILKQALQDGLIEIANHGLTHCIVNHHKPMLFRSNRKQHREFWDFLDLEIHFEHIRISQDYLQKIFDTQIETLIPPGNVYSQETILAAHQYGIKQINCNNPTLDSDFIRIIGNENIIAFHDKELVEQGIAWLVQQINKNKNKQFVFVKDL